eukprot:SAG31_NODE_3995_length_3679_cov_2.119832_1_plen_158_part_00
MALEELAHWMTNASYAEDIGLLGDMARLRLSAADYLVHGRLWSPPIVTTMAPASGMPTVTVCDWGDASSAGTPMCCNMSAVLVNAWLSPAAKVALVMVNHQVATVSVTIDVAMPTVQVTARELALGGSKQKSVSVTNGVAQVQRTLRGRSAAVLVLG